MSSSSNRELPTHIKVLDVVKPFLFGGTAGILATTCIQPLDTIKVRLQLSGEGVKGGNIGLPGMAKQILAKEGVGAFYSGIGAAWLRQAMYGTSRLGLFRVFSDKAKGKDETLPFWKKAACGLAAGAMGSFIGNPADLTLVRMQADGSLPPAQQRHYTGVGNALIRIVKEEGVTTLWRGSLPTIVRAMAMNCGMLATYDEAKEMLTTVMGEGQVTNMGSSVIAGVVAATATLPFDMLKTRIQKQVPDATGKLPYKGMPDAAIKIVKSEGPLALYKGWVTFCVRVAPHAIITLLTIEQINKFYANHRKQYE